jgi:hypothetical protein
MEDRGAAGQDAELLEAALEILDGNRTGRSTVPSPSPYPHRSRRRR